MPDTIFYAWQSDHPANVNKNFIRDAIERAIEALNAELGVEDALRADQDTQGIPGDINVAEIIFEKIDRCRVFVADVTTVTPSDAARPSPNPNVLIEYGRASVRPGSSFIVTIFNEAFGNWEIDRPFDLRHRRRPLLYTLPQNPTDEQRASARKTLVSQLTSAFRDILSAGPTSISMPTIDAFRGLQSLYEKTPLMSQKVGGVIGFWCGLLPLGQSFRLEAPWDHIEIVARTKSRQFKRGSTFQRFETIDAPFGNGTVDFSPMQQGAKYLCQYRYPPRHGQWAEDTVAIYAHTDGRLALSVRTNNFIPGPHLNRRWIMADVANSLEIMDRMRKAAQKPSMPYALLVELRFDVQGEGIFRPSGTEWRLCTLEDETGQFGTLVPSDPITVGPIAVGPATLFHEVLRTVYTDIVTCVGRKPESDLTFETANSPAKQ